MRDVAARTAEASSFLSPDKFVARSWVNRFILSGLDNRLKPSTLGVQCWRMSRAGVAAFHMAVTKSCPSATGPNFARPTTSAFPEGHLKADRRLSTPFLP